MKAETPRRKKALIVTSRNVHYMLIQPVIEELRRRNWRVVTLHFEWIWERIETRLVKRRSIASFYTRAPLQCPKKTRTGMSNLLVKLIFYLMEIFRAGRPDIIMVMTESSSPCRIAVLSGKLAKIPSLLLFHTGIIGRNYDCPTVLADKISLMGESAKEILKKCGIDENRLIVTGRPSYDSLVHAEKVFDKHEICSKLGFDPRRKIIVYATDNLPQRDIEPTVYAICKAVKKFSELQLVIKLHPSELSASMYKRVTRNVGLDALVTRNVNIYDILYVCDVMITGYSTTALDAMILNKPVITINLTGHKDPLPFAENGATIGVYKEDGLSAAIRQALYDKDVREKLKKAREKFVSKHTYKLDGKATERVVELIEQMAQDLKGRRKNRIQSQRTNLYVSKFADKDIYTGICFNQAIA